MLRTLTTLGLLAATSGLVVTPLTRQVASPARSSAVVALFGLGQQEKTKPKKVAAKRRTTKFKPVKKRKGSVASGVPAVAFLGGQFALLPVLILGIIIAGGKGLPDATPFGVSAARMRAEHRRTRSHLATLPCAHGVC